MSDIELLQFDTRHLWYVHVDPLLREIITNYDDEPSHYLPPHSKFYALTEDRRMRALGIVSQRNTRIDTDVVCSSYNIAYMGTQPLFRRQGYGRLLLERIEDVAVRQGLGYVTMHAVDSARTFYEKCGYQLNDATEAYFTHYKKLT